MIWIHSGSNEQWSVVKGSNHNSKLSRLNKELVTNWELFFYKINYKATLRLWKEKKI